MGKQQYKVVTGRAEWELEQKVQELLDAGWQLQGGMVAGPDGYSQALVREVQATLTWSMKDEDGDVHVIEEFFEE